MNPQIHSRWGLLCPSCRKQLINPNQLWPTPCATCGQRTHNKCLSPVDQWLVDLDIDIAPNLKANCCAKCVAHAVNNLDLINNIPQASGAQPQDVYKAYLAKRPPPPKKSVVSLWGPYRVDPDNFVPAVTKVLDIVHNQGPKVRWAVKLAPWQQVPMTSLSSKEIILPNYFASPNALGRTHQEILDAMTGAAMHEAGHAAYDKAATILEAQKRIKAGPGEYTWASATCLNIVCDYNLERKVIERYPAFRHYFTECHRWTVQDTLPELVKALQDTDAEDKMNIRLMVVVWEMLGPGDLEHAGAVLSPKLKFITQKCFNILKYAYTKGLLNTEPGKLKTARAIYELVRVVTPVGYQPPMIPVPMPPSQQGQQPPQPGDPGDPQGVSGFPGQPQPGQGQPSDIQQPSTLPPSTTPQDPASSDQDGLDEPEESEDADSDDDSDGTGESGTGADSTGTSGEASEDQGDDEEASGGPEESDQRSSEAEGQGDSEADDDGTGTDPGSDGDASGESDPGHAGAEAEAASEDQGAQNNNDRSAPDKPGTADNTGPEDDDAGESSVGSGPSTRGGKSGSEEKVDPANDPFTGMGDMQDDPTRRKNAKKDALDDLEEQNQGQPQINELHEQDLTNDPTFDKDHRNRSDQLGQPPAIDTKNIDKASAESYFGPAHANRVKELSPVISRLKKVLRFRNVDWGGKQTGRRAGTLTRRHVSRLSTLGSDKVFHTTQPDQTPKVRIGLLIDESQSMQDHDGNGLQYYIGAKNAATALTGALHGIRGVKLWSWGFADLSNHNYPRSGSRHTPTMRQYVDPSNNVSPATIEVNPMFGGTPTGECMDYAAEVITKNATPDEKIVIFIITDGEAGGVMSTATAVRKWWGKVTFVHIGLGTTVDPEIPFYIGPVTDIAILPDLLSESVSEILK